MVALIGLWACGASPAPERSSPTPEPSSPARVDPRCPSVGAVEVLGHVADPRLTEISGLVASRRHDVLWVHNDSGDAPVLHAVGLDGAERGRFELDGAEAIDWEDIALLPGDAHDWLVVGDIGDNKQVRRSVQLYRVAEPTPGDGGRVPAERMTVRWPDGPINAETLLVDPRSGELFVLSKVKAGASRLFALGPWTPGEVTARAVGSRVFGEPKSAIRTTGGDTSPDGRRMVIRTYTQAHLFEVEGALGEAIARAPCPIPTPEEPQGEAIGFRDGALILISEGAHPPIHRIPLTP